MPFEKKALRLSTWKPTGRALTTSLIISSLLLIFYLICNQFGFMDSFLSVASKVSLRLGGRVLLSMCLGWEGWLLAIFIYPLFCIEGDLSGTTSGAESAKASEHEKEASVGEQVSVEAQPQGEGSSNCEAGPSSRKDLDLNVSPHPRQATEELFNDLLQVDKRLDELRDKAPSLGNPRDIDAWRREFLEVKHFFAETEQRLKWAIENEKALYAAQDEKWAQQKADLRSQMESFLQEEAEKRRAREALFSQISQEARAQYELDREKQKQRFRESR